MMKNYIFKSDKEHKANGFTIVELMIATLIFSTVLAMLTAGVIYFTNMYYKGVNLTNTQRTARLIADNISQAIQFSGSDVVDGTTIGGGQYSGLRVLCVGSKRYTFVPGRIVTKNGLAEQPGDNAGFRGLFVDTVPSGCNTLLPAMNATNFQSQRDISSLGLANASELLGGRMRLTELGIRNIGGNAYEVKVSIALGDIDLLTATTGPDVRCKSGAGSQFCATSQLTTTVVKRI